MSSEKQLLGPHLRSCGVDAPEDAKKGFHKAKIALNNMLKGKRVSYIEVNRDKCGRIVARIWALVRSRAMSLSASLHHLLCIIGVNLGAEPRIAEMAPNDAPAGSGRFPL